jgi:hypothetical protein
MSETRYFMAYNGSCIAKCSSVEEAIQIRNRMSDVENGPSKRKSVSPVRICKGVGIKYGRFVANARGNYIGTYDTVEEAVTARKLFVETGVKTPTVRKKG